MDGLSQKDKEDAEDSEESKTLIKNLMKTNFKKNTISYTLTNIMYIDEKPTKQRNMTRVLTNPKNGNLSKLIPLRYILSEYHRLTISHLENKMVMDEKGKNQFILFKLNIC